MSRARTVRASGAVVWRWGADGEPEFLLVHRPRYDDWSLPKGKQEAGETAEQCAVREVWEETGVTGALGPAMPAARYIDQRGRAKLVAYWLLQAQNQRPRPPDAEVDELRWVGASRAVEMVHYAHDGALVRAALRVVAPR